MWIWKRSAASADVIATSSSAAMNDSPLVSDSPGAVRYGASIAAVQFSQIPSCMTLTVVARKRRWPATLASGRRSSS